MLMNELCIKQQVKADRIFMDFKYTEPGSTEQHQSLKMLNDLIIEWAHFFANKERRSCVTSLLQPT
ncbi:hypothetical protein SynBIOSE41_03677 [Synechococcus sp. BIOS-E4-1]|nr:hypothetical protein SynBIOSE41_03677 [Synechococcus sp. BIOS-E4-1]